MTEADAPVAGNPPIDYNQRVFLVGKTQSGKSTFARRIFHSMTGCQRILIDPKGQERLATSGGPTMPVRAVAAIDWAAPIIHYIPSRLDRAEYEDLFAAIWHHALASPNAVFVWLDESMGVTEKNWAPWGLRMIVQQGASHDVGLLAVSQRPVDVWAGLRTEAEHVVMFVPRPHPLNAQPLSEVVGIPRAELEARFDELHQAEGEHAFLWYSLATHELLDCAPVPV